MMYFFKTLACFNLLKVQVLHMLCTLKVERGFTFSIKKDFIKCCLIVCVFHVCGTFVKDVLV